MNTKFAYIHSEGVLGVIVHEYPDGAARIYYYNDGLSFTVDLDEEDYEVRWVSKNE